MNTSMRNIIVFWKYVHVRFILLAVWCEYEAGSMMMVVILWQPEMGPLACFVCPHWNTFILTP
jgi:hypothetical protein